MVTSVAIMAQFVLLSPPWIGRVNLGWNCLRNISSDFAKKLHHPFLQSAITSSQFPPIRIEAGNRERKMPWNWDKGKCGRCKGTLFTRWIVFVRWQTNLSTKTKQKQTKQRQTKAKTRRDRGQETETMENKVAEKMPSFFSLLVSSICKQINK